MIADCRLKKRLRRPDLRKASGFPGHAAFLLPPGSAGRLSLPAEPRGLLRAETIGKAEQVGQQSRLGTLPLAGSDMGVARTENTRRGCLLETSVEE